MARISTTGRSKKNDEETEEIAVTPSSGNVFADLGLPEPEELLRKSELIIAIDDVIKRRKLSQIRAADIVGVSQPDLSKLLRGRTMGFSLDRLVNMLALLGEDVEITIRPGANRQGRGEIVVRRSLEAA